MLHFGGLHTLSEDVRWEIEPLQAEEEIVFTLPKFWLKHTNLSAKKQVLFCRWEENLHPIVFLEKEVSSV